MADLCVATQGTCLPTQDTAGASDDRHHVGMHDHKSILDFLAECPADLVPSVLTLALIPLSASSFTIVVMAIPFGSTLSTTSSSSLKNTRVGGSQAVENMSVNEIACGSYLDVVVGW